MGSGDRARRRSGRRGVLRVGHRRQAGRTFGCSVWPPYAAPVLSTMFLVLAGFAEARVTLALAALLIAGGGLLAAQDMLRRK